MVRNCEDFRTLLTSEDRNRCETSMETNRLISEEISYQMNRKMDELKRNLDTLLTQQFMIQSFLQSKIRFQDETAGYEQMWTQGPVD